MGNLSPLSRWVGVLPVNGLCFAILDRAAFPDFLFQNREIQLLGETKALVQEMAKSNMGSPIGNKTYLE